AATRKAAAFAALPAVEEVESIASLIPNGQEERLPLVRALHAVLGDFPHTLPAPPVVDLPDLRNTLNKLKLKIRPENEAAAPGKESVTNELHEARQSLLAVIERLQTRPEAETRAAPERF